MSKSTLAPPRTHSASNTTTEGQLATVPPFHEIMSFTKNAELGH